MIVDNCKSVFRRNLAAKETLFNENGLLFLKNKIKHHY